MFAILIIFLTSLQAEPVVAKSKPAFIMPARLLSRPIVGEINFLQDLPNVSQTSSLQNQSSFAPAVVIGSNEPVDSALLNAIENPRERMQVLNLENVLLLFVKSRYVSWYKQIECALIQIMLRLRL